MREATSLSEAGGKRREERFGKEFIKLNNLYIVYICKYG